MTTNNPSNWIAQRTLAFDSSGIRKVFALAASMKNPINLSIGQPDYDVPEVIKDAACQAIRDGKNMYSPTQGIAPLIDKIQADVDRQYAQPDRKVFISSGTSGGLLLALSVLVNPGDEVLVFDPYFVMYRHQVSLLGGRTVEIPTYPDFRLDLDRVRDAITPRTKVILFNSPGNPTGAVPTAAEIEGLAKLAAERDVALISDEIYRAFCYDAPFVSPARWNERTIVVDSFSKSHSMTGWRLGWVHAPSELVQQMLKLQQFTFVCAPHPVQYAGVVAYDYDISDRVADYRQKRDFMHRELSSHYEIAGAQGAFYLLPKAPWGTASEFVAEAIAQGLLIIPGQVFSSRDTHFRISYAAEQKTLERGVEVLKRLARKQ